MDVIEIDDFIVNVVPQWRHRALSQPAVDPSIDGSYDVGNECEGDSSLYLVDGEVVGDIIVPGVKADSEKGVGSKECFGCGGEVVQIVDYSIHSPGGGYGLTDGAFKVFF